MVHYLRLVTEFALPARIANALVRFVIATSVDATRIRDTLVTPRKHLCQICDSFLGRILGPIPSPANSAAAKSRLNAIAFNAFLAFGLKFR